MLGRRAPKVITAFFAVVIAAAACSLGALLFTQTAQATTISNAAQAQPPFSPGTFDSGQPIDVVIPANTVLTPGATIFILECAAPNGVDPATTASCDGNTAYAGGTISVQSDGSVDVINTSTTSGDPYIIYSLPDGPKFGEPPNSSPKCGLGSANECVLYIGQGGGGDTGFSAPHYFSQAFQVHSDPTDSGTLNPGDGTFPADSAPAITSANSTTFTQGTAGSFSVTATGWPPPSFAETGALPSGVTLNASSGALSGSAATFGNFPITITASNGVGTAASQSFTLHVQPGISGDTIPGSAAAQSPFTPGTFDSGQPIDVVVPPNGVLTPGARLEILECAAPHGVDPTTTAACDGNTAYAGGTISVNSDGSVDVVNGSSSSGLPYPIYALPDVPTFGESPAGFPKCAQGSANECVLYIGQGGGQDTGFSLPHFFSQPFQVHADPTDSGTLNPGDGTFPADSAPAITSANHATFTQGTAGSFTVTATGYGPPAFSETGSLPAGITLNATTGALSGTASSFGTFPITITASNGVGSPATQSFTLTVQPGVSGETLPGSAAAQSPFTPGSFDSGQPIDVVVPPNPVLTPGARIEILECAAPHGVNPTTTAACDGNTAYAGGTVTVNSDGSVDVVNGSSSTGQPYPVYALPDGPTFGESAAGFPTCGQGTPNECVLYIGQGGGQDTGFSLPHFFSQPFQVHPDATDSGTLNPGDGTASQADAPPAITSGSSATFTQGTAGTFSVTSTGFGPPVITESGTLPTGVHLSRSGTLSGTPTQGGVFPITITASNGVGTPATQSFTLTVDSAPAITSASTATFTEGTAGTFTVTATGTPAPTFSVTSGTLPSGVTLSSAGVLSGTATQSGTFTFTIQASNGVGTPATQSFTLTVDSAPAITSGSSTTFTEGTAGTFTVTATGTPAPTFSVTSGTLPSGVTLSSAGVLSGTPTQDGTFTFTIQASNGVGTPATQSFTLTVDSAPAITSGSTATFTEGTAGTFTVTATGTPAPTFSVTSGTLPTGVTLSSAGVLAGTATQSGTFTFTIQASNGVGTPATQSFTLTVDSAPAITSVNHASFTQGTAGSFTVTATGNPAPTFSVTSGTLPTGVTLSSAGILAGTATQSGTFTFTIQASNGVGTPATQSFTLTVSTSSMAPAITSAASTTFTENNAGTFTVTATGNPKPTLAETGALPAGVTFNPSTGVLSGTPTVTGSFPITFTATNGVGSPAHQSFTLTVVGVRITTTSLPAATVGVAYSAQLQATGGVPPYKWKKLVALPKGLKLIASTGQITGTVKTKVAPGNYTVTVMVTDHTKHIHNTAQASFTLTVNP